MPASKDIKDMGRKTTRGKKRKLKKRILIVEDDVIIANLEREILEGEGFKIEVARDGMEGLEKIKQNGYDVIISDCDMPRMRGSELYIEVQKLSPDLAKKIIFVSGTISDFIRSTGNRFLKKPFSPQRLIEAVNDSLHLIGNPSQTVKPV